MDTERTCHELKRSQTMKAFVFAGFVLALLVMSLPQPSVGAAGKFDGSAPVICGTTAVTECGADGRCQRGTAPDVNFPAIFQVDAAGKKLKNLQANTGQQGAESSIRNVDHANGKMILSGAEGERGWSVLIHESTGQMSAAVAGDGEGFVIFGQCALP
jgi:hypothetical protein